MFIVQGWLATQYEASSALYGFIACQCLVGMVLGASKVLISLLCFDVFKVVNFASSFSILWSTFGTASLLGPVLGWWSLSGHGNPTDANYKHDLSHAVSIFCYISAGAQAVCFALSLFIKNLDFSKYAALLGGQENDSVVDGAVSGSSQNSIKDTDEEGGLLVPQNADEVRDSIELRASLSSAASFF